MTSYPAYRVAAMHVSPVFLDIEKTIDKACALIQEAADNGAQLIAFPEAFVPAFPIWSAVRLSRHGCGGSTLVPPLALLLGRVRLGMRRPCPPVRTV